MVVKHLRQKAWMGVRLHGLDEDMAGYFRVKADEGALVLGVEKESPAAKAGVKSGDVIVRIGREKVYEPGDVSDIIGDCRPGDKIEAVVVRKGIETSLTVELEESPGRFLGMAGPFGHAEWNSDAAGPLRPYGEPFSKEQWEEWSKELGDKMKNIQIRHQVILGKNQEKLEQAMKELEEKAKHMDVHFEAAAEI
jgi:membrane-associated protease RseP (regulator of RpoE activity)